MIYLISSLVVLLRKKKNLIDKVVPMHKPKELALICFNWQQDLERPKNRVNNKKELKNIKMNKI